MSFPEVFVYETWSKNRLLSSSFHGTPGAYRMALDAGGTDGEDTFFLCFRNNNDPVLDGMLDPSFRVLQYDLDTGGWLGRKIPSFTAGRTKDRERLFLEGYFSMVTHQTPPADFPYWHWADATGWSVAHQAAWSKTLPFGFSKWDLKDNHGDSVAHLVASRGYLPPMFKQWDLNDAAGRPVAFVAAQYGFLPTDFDKWNIRGPRQVTVAHIAAAYDNLPEAVPSEVLDLVDMDGCSVADILAGRFQPVSQKQSLKMDI